MAILSNIKCEDCGNWDHVSHGSGTQPPRKCNACQAKEVQTVRDLHFAELDKLTIEERLRKVEEWIYDYRPRYVPPPRF